MRLVSARIRGLGRLLDVSMNLDARVIAVVGPNEAGKTTFLRGLARIRSADAVPAAERSRAGGGDDDDLSVVTLQYVVEPEDVAALEGLPLEAPPVKATFSRLAGGGLVQVGLTPPPQKSIVPLEQATQVLHSWLESHAISTIIDWGGEYGDPASGGSRDFMTDLRVVLEDAHRVKQTPGESFASDTPELALQLRDAIVESDTATEVVKALQALHDWAQVDEPAREVRNRLWARAPQVLLFDEADRTLKSSYALSETVVADPPAALTNLASTAALDLDLLQQLVEDGDRSRYRTLLQQANQRLEAIFKDAWKQSELTVRLDVDAGRLHVELLEGSDAVTVFDERSAGLRMFVALVTFLRRREVRNPPILLIDEAENHLHLDAQADLVNMFVKQDFAAKIVYTTHSPACLPPDLGTGIRVVAPEDGKSTSTVRNNFWGHQPGFSPLMFAMGAAAAAFTPARDAVLAEGPSEMILLPTLLRAATGLDQLPYQVAPGLSETPSRLLPALDLEAARVAYLVDSDASGDELRKNLEAAGVPASLIVASGAAGLEDFVEPELLRESFVALLREGPSGLTAKQLAVVPAPTASGWYRNAAEAMRKIKLSPPSKVALATRIASAGGELVNPLQKDRLKALHGELAAVFASTP